LRQSTVSNDFSSVLNEFKNPAIAASLLQRIRLHSKQMTLMEVCGTHTVALFRSGIRLALPGTIRLVSGPGCPVCVTPPVDMETALALALRKNTVLFCFGDMLRVPSHGRSLESVRAVHEARVKIMYSPTEALEFARRETGADVVLFGVGFETTIPLFASVMSTAAEQNIHNLYIHCAFRLLPPALELLLSSEDLGIDGFILPGHVSAIIGQKPYEFMGSKYRVPGVITGFELVDMLEGILMLADMIAKGEHGIKNQYSRFVSFQGNRRAQDLIYSIFEECDAEWRGVGKIKMSGLRLKDTYKRFDADTLLDAKVAAPPEPKGCLCAQVILGRARPEDCALYKKVCTPSYPIGPCMVSSEGTCAAFYKYGG